MVKYIDKLDLSSIATGDEFLIDANVLVLLHCNELTKNEQQIAPFYSNFIAHLLKTKCKLYVSALNVQELFHAVERIYFDIYRADKKCAKKDYRKDSDERNRLAGIQRNIWQQVKGVYQVLDFPVTYNDLETFVSSYHEHRYDPIDFIVSTHAHTHNIVTDDCDFTNANGFAVYTYSGD